MNRPIVESLEPVTLVGGGPVAARSLRAALARAPRLVAADGGADRLLRAGLMPEAVIGDFDSISAEARAAIPLARQHPIAEQESTDFDKALRHIRAPLVLGLGFWGARMDHGLAALSVLARYPDRACLLLAETCLAFLAPLRLTLQLRPGDRLSLFPLGPVRGQSAGLRWPIAGIDFAPDGRIGTSNEVTERRVTLAFDAPRMLVILPRARLDAAVSALRPAAPPDAHAG